MAYSLLNPTDRLKTHNITPQMSIIIFVKHLREQGFAFYFNLVGPS